MSHRLRAAVLDLQADEARAAWPQEAAQGQARFLAGLRRSMPTGYLAGVERINGWEALVVRSPEGRPYAVLTIESDGHRVHAVRSVINPDKLRALVPPT